MRIRDLINVLERIDHDRVQSGAQEIMGDACIETDVFAPVVGSDDKLYYYAGFDHDIRIEPSDDGVYLLLNKFSRKPAPKDIQKSVPSVLDSLLERKLKYPWQFLDNKQ